VRYLEERVEELEDQARAHDGKLDEIGRDVSDMKVQLDALYREWVGE
jgi:phage shock protein A